MINKINWIRKKSERLCENFLNYFVHMFEQVSLYADKMLM